MEYHDDHESEWDDFGDLYEIPDKTQVQSSNVIIPYAPLTSAIDRDEEDRRIKALVDTPALDWQQRQYPDGFRRARGFNRGMGRKTHPQSYVWHRCKGPDGFGPGRGFNRGVERETLPEAYVCHRCKVPGHLIQHCPTNGDPTFDIRRMKPPTGIPKSMLMADPDEAAFEKEIEGLPSTSHKVGYLLPELHCPLCKESMKDAVLTSKCCFMSFCDKCIRDYTISRSMCVCGATNVLADDLLPNKTLRDTISSMLESDNSSSEKAGSSFKVQDMVSASCPQAKIRSRTMSAESKGEEKPLLRSDEPPKVEKTVDICTTTNSNYEVKWKGPNYMMPPPPPPPLGMTGPSMYNPYWGMDGYNNMAPFPYNMGYGVGPLDIMHFGGFMPHDPYAIQPMFPGTPPQQMGMNMQPPSYRKEEFEARRNREMVETPGESRELPKDRSPKCHHRQQRSSDDRPPRDLDPPRPPKRKSDHDYDYRHHKREASDHHHHISHLRRRAESSRRPSPQFEFLVPQALS